MIVDRAIVRTEKSVSFMEIGFWQQINFQAVWQYFFIKGLIDLLIDFLFMGRLLIQEEYSL